MNAFLFPREYGRVLRADGAVIFVSTRADLTPIYLSPSDVVAALEQGGGFASSAVTARAGNGCWTVARRKQVQH